MIHPNTVRPKLSIPVDTCPTVTRLAAPIALAVAAKSEPDAKPEGISEAVVDAAVSEAVEAESEVLGKISTTNVRSNTFGVRLTGHSR
jgi:hypothetical protein